ncbi:MAG: hypothetical protein HY926_12770 [Elusimicrobia bacterium]|nr:hypothetical protein [Elusimicrobiota bacterium]
MKEIPQPCRSVRESLWAAWPRADQAPAEALAHAAACALCRKEHEDLRALCGRSSAPDGAPLSWDKALAAPLWARLAARIRAEPRPSRPRRLLWVPAAALAAAGLFLFRPVPPERSGVVLMPAVEELELMEHLDLFMDWEAAQGLWPRREP